MRPLFSMTPTGRNCSKCGLVDAAPFEGTPGELRAAFTREDLDAIEAGERDAELVEADTYRDR